MKQIIENAISRSDVSQTLLLRHETKKKVSKFEVLVFQFFVSADAEITTSTFSMTAESFVVGIVVVVVVEKK